MAGAVTSSAGPRWRRAVSVGLLVVGGLLGMASVGTVFARSELLNTNRYVATVEPLADSPAIRHAVAGFVVTTIYRQVNVEQVARQALPDRGQFLAAPLSDGIRVFSSQVVERFLASAHFRSLWSAANRLAHNQLVALLEDTARHAGPVTLRDGTVTVDLSKTIADAKGQLERAGLTFLSSVHVPAPNAQYRLINAKVLAQARHYVSVLNTLTWVLPILMVAAFAGALTADVDRRRALLRVGVAFAIGMAVLVVTLSVARSLYLDAATGPNVPRDAAAAVFDTVLRYLRFAAYAGVVLGVVVAGSAWGAGPSPAAARTRRVVAAALGGVRRQAETLGWQPGRVAVYAAGHRGPLRVGAAALVFLLFIVWGQPTLAVVAGLAVVFVALMVVIELAARVGATSP